MKLQEVELKSWENLSAQTMKKNDDDDETLDNRVYNNAKLYNNFLYKCPQPGFPLNLLTYEIVI